MPFFVAGRERYALPIGESTLGGGGDALPIPELAHVAALAVVTVTPEHAAAIRPAAASTHLRVNGEPVGVGGAKLRHGAHVELAGVTLLFGDIRASGSTSAIASVGDDELALLAGLAPPEPTADHGGQLVAADGSTTYPVPADGLTIGRDPACGLVLPGKEISRRHATVAPGLLGYLLTDESANGVLVNGTRVDGARVLGQGDVVRIGDAEFRFEADKGSYEPAPELRAPVQAAPVTIAEGETRPTDGATTAAVDRQPSDAASPQMVLLATLEVLNEGAHKGTRIRIKRPLVHVGRGAHNDIFLGDESVSSAHATLRQDRGGWIVTDGGSTNGTYVDGERVRSERRLAGPAEIRFGNAKFLFRPIGVSTSGRKATRGIARLDDGM